MAFILLYCCGGLFTEGFMGRDLKWSECFWWPLTLGKELRELLINK